MKHGIEEDPVVVKRQRLWRAIYTALFVVLLGVAAKVAWVANFNYCLQQAERHESEMMTPFIQRHPGYDEKSHRTKHLSHKELAEAYRQAACYPWKLLFIDDRNTPTPSQKRPSRTFGLQKSFLWHTKS